MTDKEFIEMVRRAREEEVRFFSNLAKPERERWVVQQFLKNLSILVLEGDLFSPPQSDSIDVVFHDANFQVKELTEKNCRRSSEVREALERAKKATQPMELYKTLVAQDIELVDAYTFIRQFALNPRYSEASRSKLDLLIYVTRTYAGLDRSAQPTDLATLGWRSISCLYGLHSYVLVAANDAPAFLKDRHNGS
jgi:hypothetical protein